MPRLVLPVFNTNRETERPTQMARYRRVKPVPSESHSESSVFLPWQRTLVVQTPCELLGFFSKYACPKHIPDYINRQGEHGNAWGTSQRFGTEIATHTDTSGKKTNGRRFGSCPRPHPTNCRLLTLLQYTPRQSRAGRQQSSRLMQNA